MNSQETNEASPRESNEVSSVAFIMDWFDRIHPEKHTGGSGNYIKSMIYGGLDGIVSVFVAVAAVSGSQVGIGLALALGLAKLFAGGISMGIGDWLATDAEVDLAKREKRREEWECENYLEGEVDEMVALYVQKGVDEQTARRVVEILSKHRQAFVDIMMAEELGIPPGSVNEIPWRHGAVNFGSFMLFGVVPLIAYVIVLAINTTANPEGNTAFYITIAITVLTIFGMGVFKGKLSGEYWLKAGIITTLFGSFTAFIGWIIGWILNYSFPGDNVSG